MQIAEVDAEVWAWRRLSLLRQPQTITPYLQTSQSHTFAYVPIASHHHTTRYRTAIMDQEDTHMPNAPLTPAHESELTSPVVDFSPSTVPYNEAFENSLMELILSPQNANQPRTPSHETHMIPASSLPIPLSSPMRTHPSAVPGLHVTQPNGYHTGGPGPSPHTIADFAEQFVREQGVEDAGQLERVVEDLIREKMGVVRERMEKRKEAVEKNKGIERELEDLRLQRSAELRVMEKVKGGKR